MTTYPLKLEQRIHKGANDISRQTRRWLAGAILLGAASTTALAAAAAPASASTFPETVGTTVAFSDPTPYSPMVGGYFGHTIVAMYCWTDSAWSYGTNRWYLVEGPGFNPYSGLPELITGYVSANRIYNPARVGHC
jgi:hypothetical protein